MKIIEQGEYPKENIIKCKECNCEFQYFNSEIIVDMTTPDEEALFGGFGVYKHIKCPCCKGDVEISCSFEETVPIMTRIKQWFEKRKRK